MLTIKLKIDYENEMDTNFVLTTQKWYTHAFHYLYFNSSKIDDKQTEKFIREKYNISATRYEYLITDVNTKIEQIQTQKDKVINDIISITKEIDLLNNKTKFTKKETRKYFKLKQKLDYKNNTLSKNITFGSRNLLQRISFLSNDKINNQEQISEIIKDYKDKRILPLYFVGRACEKNSNGYFSFNFLNKTITYKPFRGKKISFSYNANKKYQRILEQLQEVKDLNVLPITIRLTTTYICISFDEQRLNNYAFDKRSK